MKKLFAILLAALLLLGLSACGGGGEGGDIEEETTYYVYPSTVNWNGTYPGEIALLTISEYNESTFYFFLDTVEDRVEGEAVLDPDSAVDAVFGEYTFHFNFDPAGEHIDVTGGDFTGNYPRDTDAVG